MTETAAFSAMAPFSAMAMQLTARSLERLPDAAAARAAILAHIAEIEGQIRTSAIFVAQYSGRPVKLVVLPEYLFTSYPGRISIPDFAARVGFAEGGPEYAALGGVAQRLGMFLAGNAYETDTAFPRFLLPDQLHRRAFGRGGAALSPPVVDVRAIAARCVGGLSRQIRHRGRLPGRAHRNRQPRLHRQRGNPLPPEIARALALRGAEVFCHSSSEIGSPLATHKDIAKQARAFENLAYVVSANTAGISGTAMPLASADGNSQVVDWKGRVVAQSGDGETFTAFAAIDLAGLREARRTPAMTNYLARQRPALFAESYAAAAQPFRGPDNMMEDGRPTVPDRDHFQRAQAEVIERLAKAGVI